MKIAVLLTVYNRKDKTVNCLRSLQDTLKDKSGFDVKIFLTDDKSTDGTREAIQKEKFDLDISLLEGTGSLYWNGGMINSWRAALQENMDFDGYLLVNDDIKVLSDFWDDLSTADSYCFKHFKKHGIYTGSTKDPISGKFTYGGFNYINKFTLMDSFVLPDGFSFQECEACHANICFISKEVVESEGIFCEKYVHGGTDHDYTYLAHKHGFPILVLPHYSAECENNHGGGRKALTLKERIADAKSPLGNNFYNTLLFNRRCFPYRLPFVFMTGILKILFPDIGNKIYTNFRRLFHIKDMTNQ